MGTTRVKLIDLSSDKKEIKTARKRAEKLEEKNQNVGTQPKEEKTEATQQTQEVQEQKEETKEKPKTHVKKTSVKQAHHRGKKYVEASQKIDQSQNYSLKDAVDILYKTSITKFDPTVEIHFNVTDKNVKASVNLPHSTGEAKQKKYLVFSDKKSADDKNIIWADDKTLDKITAGTLKPKRDFDLVIAGPKFMPQLAKVAKILGPAGMMPNPKTQTVTDDPAKFLKSAGENTTVEFRTDPTAPIIHTKLGKLSFKPNQIEENLKTLILAIGPTKIQKATLTSTMSPAIKVDVTTAGK